uniref:Uncharacterized protein n=2 Tax=Aegilops tauschii subsp. strangulata TaxID=200361 RepID=A0A453HB04_AEGTS
MHFAFLIRIIRLLKHIHRSFNIGRLRAHAPLCPGVLDDTYALCMAGKQKVVTLLHLIVAYKDETEYNVLAHAINSLLFLF